MRGRFYGARGLDLGLADAVLLQKRRRLRRRQGAPGRGDTVADEKRGKLQNARLGDRAQVGHILDRDVGAERLHRAAQVFIERVAGLAA